MNASRRETQKQVLSMVYTPISVYLLILCILSLHMKNTIHLYVFSQEPISAVKQRQGVSNYVELSKFLFRTSLLNSDVLNRNFDLSVVTAIRIRA